MKRKLLPHVLLAATQEQLQRALYAARQAEANCELAHKRAEVLEMQAAFGLGAAFLGFAFGAMGFMYPRRRVGAWRCVTNNNNTYYNTARVTPPASAPKTG